MKTLEEILYDYVLPGLLIEFMVIVQVAIVLFIILTVKSLYV